ncbi:MAG: hypothetical protein ACXV5L_10555, partial [Thermoanaerobaculia bacterium]
VKWYRKAAEAPRQNQSGNLESVLSGPAGGKGFAPSQNNLGEVYQRGEGVTKDLEEAARWYRLAADQEYSAAQRNLGLMYQTGEGVVKDPAQAQRWLRKAAEQGDDDAQYDLGRMLLDGEGALKDRIEGREWLQEAAYQGNEKAKETLDKLRAGYPAASGAQTVPRVDVATGGNFTGEPIELRVANADVRGVLGMFAKVTDLNIVLDSRVRARITGDFAGPWDSILAKIIETNALTYKILGNAMAIGPKDSPLMDSALLTGTSNDNPVSITVSDARLQDVLDTFAKLGVNFNSGGVELDGSVTAFVADVPLMKLSRLILAANGYACDDQDGAVRIRPLKGIERFAGFAPSASRRCQAGACDDVQFMNLEGTLTPQKAGSQTVALFELSTDRYRVVTAGDTIGSTGRVIDAAAGKVIVSDRSGGRDLPSTFVITVPSP